MSAGRFSQPLALDVDELLTIDVDAELRKLAVAQFQGPWQLPTEFVRRSLAAGANRVDVRLARARFEVTDDGAPLSYDTLEHLATLLDSRAEASRRHTALLALESLNAPSLLALGGLSAARIHVASAGHCLDVTSAGVSLQSRKPTATTHVRAQELKLDPRRAREWLVDKCRFSSKKVYLHGEPIPSGFDDYLATRSLHTQDPRWQAHREINAHALTGTICLPRIGDGTRVVLLRHGVVATHVSIQNAPCFEAIVDVGPALTGPTTAETLRAALREWLEPLNDQAVELLHKVVSSIDRGGPRVQERILTLLLLAARRRKALERLSEIPCIPCLESDATTRTRVSLAELNDQARRTRAPLLALFPEQNPGDFALAGSRVLVIDVATRGVLSELLKIQFRTPAPRRDTRRLGNRIRAAIGHVLGASWLHRAKRPIPDDQLTRSEGNFLSGLRAIATEVATGAGRGCPTEISLCEGDGPPTRSGTAPGHLWLPRNNPDVRACIHVHANKGDAWLYVAALALLGGQGLPSRSARATWLRNWESSTQ